MTPRAPAPFDRGGARAARLDARVRRRRRCGVARRASTRRGRVRVRWRRALVAFTRCARRPDAGSRDGSAIAVAPGAQRARSRRTFRVARSPRTRSRRRSQLGRRSARLRGGGGERRERARRGRDVGAGGDAERRRVGRWDAYIDTPTIPTGRRRGSGSRRRSPPVRLARRRAADAFARGAVAPRRRARPPASGARRREAAAASRWRGAPDAAMRFERLEAAARSRASPEAPRRGDSFSAKRSRQPERHPVGSCADVPPRRGRRAARRRRGARGVARNRRCRAIVADALRCSG